MIPKLNHASPPISPELNSVENSQTPSHSSYDFVRKLISSLGDLIKRATGQGSSVEDTNEPPAERPTLVEMRLDCEHAIIFNSSSGQYTLIAPAPPIKNLAISGGGAKGVILTGVIRAFEHFTNSEGTFREQIDNIAGSSIGAITAALIAAGMPAERFIEVTRNTDFKKMLGTGFGPVNLDGKPILVFLRTYLKESIEVRLKQVFGKDELNQITADDILHKLQHLEPAEQEKVKRGVEQAIEQVMKPAVNDVMVTFSMLRSLHILAPKVFKDLTVTATCRDNGTLCHFDADATPNMDIAIGCRASGSLPLVLSPVLITREALSPGYANLLPGKDSLSFVDGGYLDNIPVAALEGKQQGKHTRGVFGQNLQTLALVFDTTGRDEEEQSPYHDEKVDKNVFLNPKAFVERVLRDLLPRKIGRINTQERNTLLALKGHETIRTRYVQRNIPLLISINAVNFKHAKKHEEKYCNRGYQQTIEYLKNHENEMVYFTSNDLNEIVGYLPLEFVKGLDLSRLSKPNNE